MEKHCVSVTKPLYASPFTERVMPRSCSVCRNDNTADIAKAIAAGGSNQSIALRFEVTESAAQRHRVNCLRAPRRQKKSGRDSSPSESDASIRFDSANAKIVSPKDLLSRLQSLFRLGDLLEEAITRKDVDAVVKLAREVRATAESYAKVAGWLAVDGASSTTVIDNRKVVFAQLASMGVDGVRAALKQLSGAAIEAESTLEDVTVKNKLARVLPAPEGA